MSSDKKKLNKTEKDRKNMEKENNNDKSDSSENEIPVLNSLKPFKFELKTNIGDIISSSNDDEAERAECKVKWISNNECASAVQTQSLADVLQNRCQACTFIKKRLQHRCFPLKFTKSLRTPFFTENLHSDVCFWQ